MTLKDVAQKANCSVATVSKALKNSSEISEEAKKRILTVAKECGYLKKATTHKAVLGGFKTVIFCDVKGNSAAIYTELSAMAKKRGLVVLYVVISQKDAVELMDQIGALGVVITGRTVKDGNEKLFCLSEKAEEAADFLKLLSEYMPSRPSRAVNGNEKPAHNTDNKAKPAQKKQEEPKPAPARKEEIWLL